MEWYKKTKESIGRAIGMERKSASAETMKAEKAEVAGKLLLLTPREREVFEWIVKGKKLKEIGEILGIKFSTVNTHQKKIYKKLEVNSRIECMLRYGAR